MVSSLIGKEEYVVKIQDVNKDMVGLVGGKAANLGELIAMGARVPPGFVVTSKAFNYFLRSNGIFEKVNEILSSKDDRQASADIKALIMNSSIPRDLEQAIASAYEELTSKVSREVLVAVRSSATAEDLTGASFAGQQDTYLNVRREELMMRVKMVWASLFNERAISYRRSKGIGSSSVSMGVVVQMMVNARSAGVMFTLNPANGDRNHIVIESNWGLGESVAAGKVTPDEVVIDKDTLTVIEARTSHKALKIVYDGKENKEVQLSPEEADSMSVKEEEAIELAKMAKEVEKHYGRPMDLEWAIDADLPFPENIFIVQARPETFWSKRTQETDVPQKEATARILTKGLPASPGIGAGRARVILDVSEAKDFQKGDVLVTRMTDPDWVPVMRLASALVTDEGGMTSHAAIVSRELGVPAVVGVKNGTKVIKDGQLVTVDGFSGVVYEGDTNLVPRVLSSEVPASMGVSKEALTNLYPITATKIYMNLGQPDMISRYVDLPFDGIGLMRIEFIVSEWIKYHPLYLIKTGQQSLFVDKLSQGIAMVASAIRPRPVVVRFSDFKTNEYRRLRGGEEFEVEERNPMLGWRGVSRYISAQYEEAFRLELRAVLKVRDEMGLQNVWVMYPFVRTRWELQKAMEIMEEEGLRRTPDFKVWIMAEVPSVVMLAEEFAQIVDGFSIGSNDLAQLTLGVDRDSELLANMGYYDERDEALKRAIKRLIRAAHKHGKTVSICGQAPSVYPELTEFLVREGIDSVSVNPDTVIQTRRLVASVEQKIVLDKLRSR
ncbi:phosphoenolpyruvate synthase [Sulfodiicoccus acidiphilus]|uniref:Phosphoenolpyruvate synthase n=1 Tax=Sulfodiicoccus acidiphilus TaxID=1670455 RepID=A0A348B3B5_9CREN|nr:pyruvate, water dikinase [Sulfodiicoccus acidiphilus]BBD72667.1 phosphoenolpyruvate synthase [Sulfodiicoccus acidiphilus]GGT95603.1 phosphoenolpyruvate synthase [Sulfodiicoccus acidiphilus]